MAEREQLTPDRLHNLYIGSALMHNEMNGRTVDVSRGSELYIKARTQADVFAPAMAQIEATAAFVEDPLGSDDPERIDAFFRPIGASRRPATGAVGEAIIRAISGGGNIPANTLIRHKKTGNVYKSIVPRTYADGEPCLIAATTKGPETNLEPDEVLEWLSPPFGINVNAVVGSKGLTGGAPAESNARYIERVNRMRGFPGVLGNEDKLHEFAFDAPNVPIDRTYSFASVPKRGMTSVAFTIIPANAWDSRAPTPAQIAVVRTFVESRIRHEDILFWPSVVNSNTSIAIGLRWKSTAAGWTDVLPWPQYTAPTLRVRTSGGSATLFTLYANVATTDPVPGQTIAFFAPSPEAMFVRKRISAVNIITPGLEWEISADISNSSAPHSTYIPQSNQLVSPYGPELDEIAAYAFEHFATIGLGEMVDVPSGTFTGARQRRYPISPDVDSSVLTDSITQSLFKTGQLSAASLLDVTEVTTPIGTPGVSVRLLRLTDLGVFPK
jgi:hypothetical protein